MFEDAKQLSVYRLVPGSKTRGRRKYLNLLFRTTHKITKAICGRLKIDEICENAIRGHILPSGMLTYKDQPPVSSNAVEARGKDMVLSKEAMERIAKIIEQGI